MTDKWQTFLDKQGAQRNAEGVHGFDTAGNSQNRLLALDHLGYLLVSGPEAKKFLQGQVTCDMQLVREDHSQPGAHCNSKGRIVFSFRVVELPSEDSENVALVMHRGLLENARQALQKFIVFSKAKLSLGEDYRMVGLAGPDLAQLLQAPLPRLPIANHDLVRGQDMLGLRVSGDRLLCLLRDDAAENLWQSWASHCQLGGYPDWNLADIRDGIGQVIPGTEDMFIPQMLNMQVTGGVSFTKGCYVGQEVVARMQYLGKLKRHMRHFSSPEDLDIAPGAPLYSRGSAQSVGNVVLAAPTSEGGSELLAVTTDSTFEKDELYLDAERSQKLEVLSLPYAITK